LSILSFFFLIYFKYLHIFCFLFIAVLAFIVFKLIHFSLIFLNKFSFLCSFYCILRNIEGGLD
jgi:hypothetical protein